jgi:hypothetical protein
MAGPARPKPGRLPRLVISSPTRVRRNVASPGRKWRPTDGNEGYSMNNLAWAYQAAGKPDLALRLYEETLKLSIAAPANPHRPAEPGKAALLVAHFDGPAVALRLDEVRTILVAGRGARIRLLTGSGVYSPSATR